MNETSLVQFRNELGKMRSEIAMVLPPHISLDRFARVFLTAVQRTPSLLSCTRRSLWNSILACAQDGLLPDGREAVLVEYRGKDGGAGAAGYIPMTAGLIKKLRESADIASIMVEVVRRGDTFHYRLGDEPSITHEPALDGDPFAPPLFVYSIVKFSNGEISRCVMTWKEVIAIRDRFARTRSGPWFDPVTIGEMGKKTCLRRHCKRLPLSPEAERVLTRGDEALYDLKPQPQVTRAAVASIAADPVIAALDDFAGAPAEETPQEPAKRRGRPPKPKAEDVNATPATPAPYAAEAAQVGSHNLYFGYDPNQSTTAEGDGEETATLTGAKDTITKEITDVATTVADDEGIPEFLRRDAPTDYLAAINRMAPLQSAVDFIQRMEGLIDRMATPNQAVAVKSWWEATHIEFDLITAERLRLSRLYEKKLAGIIRENGNGNGNNGNGVWA